MAVSRLTVLCLCFICASGIHIKNNAYEGITISFSEDVKEQHFNFEKFKAILEKSSEYLFHAIRNRSYFGEFVISLPLTWTAEMCQKFTNEPPRTVDIYITHSENDDDSQFRTQHSRGCGAEGDLMYMPLNWMKGNVPDLAREFVQQWSIYRYGVFEENAVEEGTCYRENKEFWTPVGCYNVKINTTPTFENGLPACYLPHNFFEEDVKSSLMSINSLTKALDFCDGSPSFPHNPAVPTLHNNLCEGQTVWSVVQNSKDFKYGRNLPKNNSDGTTPLFKCYREEPIQITFAIQNNTVDQDLSEVMVEMGFALYQFLTNMVTPGSHDHGGTRVNVVMFSSSNDSSVLRTLDLTSADLATTIAYHVKTFNVISNVCLSCGLQKALDVSQKTTHSAPIVVLIAWESALISEKTARYLEILQSYPPKVRLHLVLVEDTDSEVVTPSLVEAVHSTGGLIYGLPKEMIHMASKLQVIMAGIVKNPLQVEDQIVVIHEAMHRKIDKNFEDIFIYNVEHPGKMVYLMFCDRNNVLKVENDNCSTALGTSVLKSNIFTCGNVAQLEGNAVSLRSWRYPFKFLGSTVPPNCSSVAMVTSSHRHSYSIRGWLSEHVIKGTENALKIYAEVISITDQKFQVTAQISGPGGQFQTFDLRDNGNGDPDVRAGDKIYSRYFTSYYKKGTYTVSISARLLQEGTLYAEGNPEKTADPVQNKIIGFFSVIETLPDVDILPPNRIVDLRAIHIDHENSTVTLQWTAPGNNYDHGTADAYEIKYSSEPSKLTRLYFDMQDNKPLLAENIAVPKESGGTETFVVKFPPLMEDQTYFITIRAVDANKNRAKLSNMIQIHFNASQRLTTMDDFTSPEISTVASTTMENNTSAKDITNASTDVSELNSTLGENVNYTTVLPPDENEVVFDAKFITVLSSACGILLLIIIINIILCCYFKRKRSKKPDETSRKSSLGSPYNLNVAYQEDSQSIESENDNGLSLNTFTENNVYAQPQPMTGPTQQRYAYHTSKSLENKANRHKDPELGFRVVKTMPACATSSLSRYKDRLNKVGLPSQHSETKSVPAENQLSTTDKTSDTQIYHLGSV